MFKKIMNKKLLKNQKGLTLIELLAVIVILAIIAAIAIPAIGNIINNSRDKAIISEGLNIISGAKIAKMDGTCDGGATKACNQDNLKGYVEGVTGGTSVTYEAKYDATKDEWTLTFSKFASGFKGTKYKISDGSNEATMKDALENGVSTGTGK